MKVVAANLWNTNADIIAVTTNGNIKDGKLIMGAGAAKAMRDRYPGIDRWAATQITGKRYGWISNGTVGMFQSKINYWEPSTVKLIEFSVKKLLAWLEQRPGITVALNFPGIGLGGLTEEEVLPLIEVLPDTVTIYKAPISAKV